MNSTDKLFSGIGILALLLTAGHFCALGAEVSRPGYYFAEHTDRPIKIDGKADEPVWDKAEWLAIGECYLGSRDDENDFSGRFKAVWEGNTIYLIVEVVDNVLTNQMNEGFENYWMGDYVEVFLDPDRSGGDHQYNNNAFAFHIMSTGEVVDMYTDGTAVLFPNIARLAIVKDYNKYVWEIAITVYSDKYDVRAVSNERAKVLLKQGNKLGFTVAYGDNDGDGFGRRSFYGSTPGQGDTGYVNADKFGVLELK